MRQIKWTELGKTPQGAMKVINDLELVTPYSELSEEDKSKGIVAKFRIKKVESDE